MIGFNVLTSHNVDLVKESLIYALINHPKPNILHSDQGGEYTAREYINLMKSIGVQISMSRKKSSWENGYQEGFYSQFKLDLGDPNRFNS